MTNESITICLGLGGILLLVWAVWYRYVTWPVDKSREGISEMIKQAGELE